MEPAVLFEKNNGIATITLNRPERRNSINQELLTLLYTYIEEITNDDLIQVGIITGNGKSFCSGIDLKALPNENIFDPRGDGRDLPDIVGDCNKPLIAAVNGHAITGGFEIALNCDFIIASKSASFADTHAKVGIHPGWGMTQLLQQAVGQRRAKQLSLTCQFLSAEKALQWGLVNEVLEDNLLLERTREIAASICETNPLLRPKIKRLIELQNEMPLQQSYKKERADFRDFVQEAFKGLK